MQAERVGALVKDLGASAAGSERAVEMQAARDRILDAQSAIEACQARRSELLQRIQVSMKADKAARAAELQAKYTELVGKNVKLKREFITALAAAAVAQMKYSGWQDRLKKTGPFIKTVSDPEAQNFFESEIERLWKEAKLEECGPYSDKIKLMDNRIATYRGPISAEDVQAAIEAVRQARAKA